MGGPLGDRQPAQGRQPRVHRPGPAPRRGRPAPARPPPPRRRDPVARRLRPPGVQPQGVDHRPLRQPMRHLRPGGDPRRGDLGRRVDGRGRTAGRPAPDPQALPLPRLPRPARRRRAPPGSAWTRPTSSARWTRRARRSATSSATASRPSTGGEALVDELLDLHTTRQLVALAAILERVEGDLRAASIGAAHAPRAAARGRPGEPAGHVRRTGRAAADLGRPRQAARATPSGANGTRGSPSRTASGSSAASSSAWRAAPGVRSRRASATTCAASPRVPRPPSSSRARPPRSTRSASRPGTGPAWACGRASGWPSARRRSAPSRSASPGRTTARRGSWAARPRRRSPWSRCSGRRSAPTWGWQAAAITRALRAAEPVMGRDARVVLLLEGDGPESLVACTLGGVTAGYRHGRRPAARRPAGRRGGMVELVPPGSGAVPRGPADARQPGPRAAPRRRRRPGPRARRTACSRRPSAAPTSRSPPRTPNGRGRRRGGRAQAPRRAGDASRGSWARSSSGSTAPATSGASCARRRPRIPARPRRRPGSAPGPGRHEPRARRRRPAAGPGAVPAPQPDPMPGTHRRPRRSPARARPRPRSRGRRAAGSSRWATTAGGWREGRPRAGGRAPRRPRRVGRLQPPVHRRPPVRGRVPGPRRGPVHGSGPARRGARARLPRVLPEHRAHAGPPGPPRDDLARRSKEHSRADRQPRRSRPPPGVLRAGSGSASSRVAWAPTRWPTTSSSASCRARRAWAGSRPATSRTWTSSGTSAGSSAIAWEVEWTAMLSDTVLRRHARIPIDERLVRFLVVLPERAELVRHKLDRSPLLREGLEAGGWHLVKANHVRDWAAREQVELADLEPLLGLDPAVERTGDQLSAVRRADRRRAVRSRASDPAVRRPRRSPACQRPAPRRGPMSVTGAEPCPSRPASTRSPPASGRASSPVADDRHRLRRRPLRRPARRPGSRGTRRRARAVRRTPAARRGAVPEEGLPVEDRITRDMLRIVADIVDRGGRPRASTRSATLTRSTAPDRARPAGAVFQPADTPERLERWLARLRAYGPYIDANIEILREGIASGRTSARIVAERTIRQLEGLARPPVEASPIVSMSRVAADADRARVRPRSSATSSSRRTGASSTARATSTCPRRASSRACISAPGRRGAVPARDPLLDDAGHGAARRPPGRPRRAGP